MLERPTLTRPSVSVEYPRREQSYGHQAGVSRASERWRSRRLPHVQAGQKSLRAIYGGRGKPTFRGIGVRDTRELPLGTWKRLGGRGSFLHLRGIESLKGLYVVEVPAAGALNPERHMYDEFYLVIEARRSTEVWRDGDARP